MLTFTVEFPICQTPEVDYEGIRKTQELEDRLNANTRRQHTERVVKALPAGDYERLFQAFKYPVRKYILNSWKFK